MSSQCPVLVVGAGPVGLATAAWLAKFGVPVRIIDKNDAPTTESRAMVLWRRSLMVLDPLVPVSTWEQQGVPMTTATFLNSGALITQLHLAEFAGPASGHLLPAGVMLPQSEVEATLAHVLLQHGVTVERRTTLTSFTADTDGVECQVQRGDAGDAGDGGGGSETLRAAFLVGADGAHSAVRRALGVSFDGVALMKRFLLADLEYEVVEGSNPSKPQHPAEGDVGSGCLCLCGTPIGILGVFVIRPGLARLVMDGGPVAPDAPRQPPTLEAMQAALLQHTRLQWRFTAASWLSDFRVHERLVGSYVHGRVLLAGDAAHVHSPAGGQGMNTGLQDATNLAWKLALVTSGAAPHQLLDSYNAERRPVAAGVLALSGRMLRTFSLRWAALRWLRGLALATALRFEALRRLAAASITEDAVAYPDSPLNGAGGGGWVKPGCAFPDLPLEVGGQLRPATQLLRCGPDTFGTLVLAEGAVDGQWPTEVRGRRLAVRRLGVDTVDAGGALAASLGLNPGGGALVRPDGVVAVVGGPDAVAGWLGELVGAAQRLAR